MCVRTNTGTNEHTNSRACWPSCQSAPVQLVFELVCVCACVHTYVSTFLCVFVGLWFISALMYSRVRACTHLLGCIWVYSLVHEYVCAHLYVRLYVCLCICAQVWCWLWVNLGVRELSVSQWVPHACVRTGLHEGARARLADVCKTATHAWGQPRRQKISSATSGEVGQLAEFARHWCAQSHGWHIHQVRWTLYGME